MFLRVLERHTDRVVVWLSKGVTDHNYEVTRKSIYTQNGFFDSSSHSLSINSVVLALLLHAINVLCIHAVTVYKLGSTNRPGNGAD